MSASQLSRDYFWNTASSLISSFSIVIMLAVVTHSAGVAAGGVFSLAIAIGQQWQTLGMYEVRTFHVTDVRREFDFPIYLATRILTVAAMIAGIVIYSLFSGGLSTSVGLVIAIALLRVFDAYEDVFYSEFQREGRLDLGARAILAYFHHHGGFLPAGGANRFAVYCFPSFPSGFSGGPGGGLLPRGARQFWYHPQLELDGY